MAEASTKTDNGDFAAKIALRRYFMSKYHANSKSRVIDCCQGSGLIWTRLRKEFDCDYWGVDLKPKKGRLKIDSQRILCQPGGVRDVVDIDTYGSPWKHWVGMLPNIKRPTTVFLTVGWLSQNPGSVAISEVKLLGINFRTLSLPSPFIGKLRHIFIPWIMSLAQDYGLTIIDAKEAVSGGHARYFGLHLKPLHRNA